MKNDTPRQKPTLQVMHLPFYRVKMSHLEMFLAKVYHLDDFSFLIATGVTPGVCPEYTVQPALPNTWNAREVADKIRKGRRTNNMALIFNMLCLDGYIPAGHYVVDTKPEPPPIQTYRDLLMRTENPDHQACVAFKQEHSRDKEFKRMAGYLDQAAREQLTTPPTT
jgi:hypothetical protein